MAMTADDYFRQLQALLPHGAAWPRDPEANLSKFLRGIAEELARVDARGETLINEADPSTSSELIAEWERVVGPFECGPVGDRNKLVVAKLAYLGGQSPKFFVDLAAKSGVTVEVREFRPAKADVVKVGDPLCDNAWAHTWMIVHPTIEWYHFRIGDPVGWPLRVWKGEAVAFCIGKYQPAHTRLLFGNGTIPNFGGATETTIEVVSTPGEGPEFTESLVVDLASEPGQTIPSDAISIASDWLPNQLTPDLQNQEIVSQGALDAALQDYYDRVEPLITAMAPGSLRFPGGLNSNQFDWKKSVGTYDVRYKQYSPGSGTDGWRYWFGLKEFLDLCARVGADPVLCLPLTLQQDWLYPASGPNNGQSSKFYWWEPSKVAAWAVEWIQWTKANGYDVKTWDVTVEAFRPNASASYANVIKAVVPAMLAEDPALRFGIVAEDSIEFDPSRYNAFMSDLWSRIKGADGAYPGMVDNAAMYFQRHTYRPLKDYFGGAYPSANNPDHVRIALATGARIFQFLPVDPTKWGASEDASRVGTWLNEFSTQYEGFEEGGKQVRKTSIAYDWLGGLAFASMQMRCMQAGLRASHHTLTDVGDVAAPPHGLIGGVGENLHPIDPSQRLDDPFLRPHGHVLATWAPWWKGRRLTLSTFDAKGRTYDVPESVWTPKVTQSYVDHAECRHDDGKVCVSMMNRDSVEHVVGVTFKGGFTPGATVTRRLTAGALTDHNEFEDTIGMVQSSVEFDGYVRVPAYSAAAFLFSEA